MFALLILFLCVILHTMWSIKSLQLLWYTVLVCHQNDVSEYSIGSVYDGEYGGLSESRLCVLCKLCPVGFLVVGKNLSDLLQSIVTSYVDCGDDR